MGGQRYDCTHSFLGGGVGGWGGDCFYNGPSRCTKQLKEYNTTENIQMNRVTCFWSCFYTERRREESERGKGWVGGLGVEGQLFRNKEGKKSEKKSKKSEPLLIGQHIHCMMPLVNIVVPGKIPNWK